MDALCIHYTADGAMVYSSSVHSCFRTIFFSLECCAWNLFVDRFEVGQFLFLKNVFDL